MADESVYENGPEEDFEGGGDPTDVLSLEPNLSYYFPFLPYFNSTQRSSQELDDEYHQLAPPDHYIQAQRNRMGDKRLFLDELLALLDIGAPPSLFPCPDALSFQSLLISILSSPQATLKIRCIILYLVLSFSAPLSSNPSKYAHDTNLPQGYVKSILSFFQLDNNAYKEAVSNIVDPHLTPDFLPKVFRVLSTMTSEEERSRLVLRFWRLSGVVLEGEEQVGIVLDALCDKKRPLGSIWEAWKMARGWVDPEGKERLYKRILIRVFGGVPERTFGGQESVQEIKPTPISQHLQTLLVNPFTPFEESLSREFCLNPPPSLDEYASLVADWRLSKYVTESNPVEAVRFGNELGGLKKGNESRERLLRGVKSTLTEVQRSLLDLDLDDDDTPAATSSATTLRTLTQPAWKPQPLPPPSPLPQSLLSIPSKALPKPSSPASASDLPLSASPFLRKEKQLVGTKDGSRVGGTEKSVLRAIRDGASPAKERGESLGVTSQDGRLLSGNRERTPTLSGFGSLRRMGSNTSFRFDSPQPSSSFDNQRQESPAPSISIDVETPSKSKGFSGLQQQQKQDFALRATMDPAIAATISAAAPPPPPTTSTKRRDFSSKSSAPSPSGEKRRAVSRELEDRPSSSIAINREKEKDLPGAFPGQDGEEEGGWEMVRTKEPSVRRPKRATRASSAAPEPEVGQTPRKRGTRASSVALEAGEGESGTPVAVRRSRRVASATPGKEKEKEVTATTAKKATTTRKGRKTIVEE